MGTLCLCIHDDKVRDVKSTLIQCDEIWSIIYCKSKNVAHCKKLPDKAGDVWTWVALDPESKLVVAWLCGDRSINAAENFMCDLASRLSNRIQLTTDGYVAYPEAVKLAFRDNVDYARYIKVFGGVQKHDPNRPMKQRRYSPKPLTGIDIKVISGTPSMDHCSTSLVERQNYTMRMQMRRFTRLTNGFSKKFENHVHALAIHFTYCNFIRVHSTIKTAPAVHAGLIDNPWTIEDLVKQLEIIEESEYAMNYT